MRPQDPSQSILPLKRVKTENEELQVGHISATEVVGAPAGRPRPHLGDSLPGVIPLWPDFTLTM